MGKYSTRGANKRVQRNITTKENCSNFAGPDDEAPTNMENKRGRKASRASVEYEKDAKRIKKTVNSHDSYCWKCKKIESDIECFPEFKCSTCVRTFHTSCIKAKINRDKVCYVCQQQSSDKMNSNIDDDILLPKLLFHIIDTACPMDKPEYFPIVEHEKLINKRDSQDPKEHENLISKKDVCHIRDRCSKTGIQYESYVEFVDDIEWIHHNCVIVRGEKSSVAISAKKILNKVQKMLKDACDCPECYYNKIGNKTFLSICKTPHPLVWAKVKGYPYWPAKCLKVSKDNASVRFFGTYQIGNVPLSNVLAMSKKYPFDKADTKSKKKMDFIMATEQLGVYIKIFNENYGTYPYERDPLNINNRFNFEKEEIIMKELALKHSRRMIVSEVDFLPPANPEPVSYPAVVDLTETENGVDQAQQKENVDPIILQTQGNIFENATKSTIDTNNSDNVESIMDTINSDSMIKKPDMASGDSNENILSNQKEFQAIQQAISGRLLPGQISDHNNMNWLTQGISISNVMSGTDVPSNNDLSEVASCETEPAFQNTDFSLNMSSPEADIFRNSPVLPQNSISSSNSVEVCVKSNYGRSLEAGNFCVVPSNTFREDIEDDCEIIEEIPTPSGKTRDRADVEIVLQSILKYDPRSYEMLKKANNLVQDLFIQFWGTTASLRNPEKTIQCQADEIRTLRAQLSELRRENNILRTARFEEKIQNAGNIVRMLRNELLSAEEKYKSEKDKLDLRLKTIQQDNERLIEEIKKLTKEKEKMVEDFKKHSEKSERLYEERIREAKTNKYCDNVECYQMARVLCCYSGLRSYAYCSEKCKANDDVHRRTVCKAVNKPDTQQPPEEKEAGISEQVVAREVQQHSTISSFTYTISSIQSHTTNKEITSTSASPQTSSANLHQTKKVAAKKTFEVAKNINRSSNADIF